MKNRLVRAYDDILDREQNLVYAFAQQGYDAHTGTPFRELQVPLSNARVQAAIKRACKDGRILEVPKESSLELSVRASKSGSQFGRHFKPVVGPVAEDYARWLHEQKRSAGYDWSLTQKYLSGVDWDHNIVFRPVGLGGDDCDIVSVAGNIFGSNGGRARGEAHGAPKISS